MNGVDYHSAHHCLIESRKSSPYELGLGWTVKLDREPFIGQAALRREKEQGSRHAFVGLIADWPQYEKICDEYGLPPQVPAGAQRDPVPIYDENDRQVGRATTRAWSPMLKQFLAIGQIHTEVAELGTRLQLEVTPEWERRRVTAVVSQMPFFYPERKRKP
jgi:aminomethyltransferase